MKRTILYALSVLLLSHPSFSQGPVFHQSDIWTLSYEDLSDLFRKYPGMYPQDYGTLGAPMLIRPWNLSPWELRVERDGIPQNRSYDGLYDPNLQPAGELETIQYDFLSPGATGRFDLFTRQLEADSPYTEFQIREGYYGYGTVDLAHGQRVYKSLVLDVTGRLAWYNGMRPKSASRFNRVRAKLGMDFSKRWRGELTYSGSNVSSDFIIDPTGTYAERSEGIFSLSEKDSFKSALDPSLKLFLRQDREGYGNPYETREETGGWVAAVAPTWGGQHLSLRQTGMISDVNFPNLNSRQEISLRLQGSDSVDFGPLGVRADAGVERQSDWLRKERAARMLSNAGIRGALKTVGGISLLGGVDYSEETVPIAWWRGNYHVLSRPLVISPEFTNLGAMFSSDSNVGLSPVDGYLKTSAGLRWQKEKSSVEIQLLSLNHPGDFTNHFAVNPTGDTIAVVHDKSVTSNTKYGVSTAAQIPLIWGLRIDSWVFAQSDASDAFRRTDMRSYSRLYFERSFFSSPLTIRAHVSHEFIDRHYAFSDSGTAILPPANITGFRLSATIRGVTLIWGTENLLKQPYQILPKYNMIGKEEYIGFIWRLWL